ncbi:MAG: hypothetical protein KJO40_19220 [Deltaproteobacteria bacterium]|nr:hypothetical protein [Deltaproteobacteria bacterium]NND28512.1 hypothetical protein [Myxococcales bacterium]MBT8463038.1 hypothetical protein [Deltaproteobacteria bacterium]MBT8482980.1 hypothetical protein [Deltaproteobacteria bacterium]NNK08618.1 hypothetical protein [Myxococcales bacterium]
MGDGEETKGRKSGRKERVLHTRVPAVLEQELKRVASAWRVPVSNVVRALLEDALDTIDVVGAKAEGELREVAELLSSERQRFRRKSSEQLSKIPGAREPVADAVEAVRSPDSGSDPLAGAVGATPIILVHDAVCGVTGATLAAGSEAYMILFDEPGRQLITGRGALPRASTPNEEKADD